MYINYNHICKSLPENNKYNFYKLTHIKYKAIILIEKKNCYKKEKIKIII